MLLAGDIGGTKTTLALFDSEHGPRSPLEEQIFPSGDYGKLEDIIVEFLAPKDVSVGRAVFGVAGPVVDGRAAITNLPWTLDEKELARVLRVDAVHLLNDLQAIAYGISLLQGGDLETLNLGSPDPQGVIAVIAPGTGLGESFVCRDGSDYRAYPSEGGHTDFAPSTAQEVELLRFLQTKMEHVSYERVCSGMGIPNIYQFLKETGGAEEPPWLREKLSSADDPTPIIVNAALDAEDPCEICQTALFLFVSILGAEAGNLALKVLATGGVYLAGGMPPRILPVLKDGRFMNAFTNKGRLSGLLTRVPVHVILAPAIALMGAASYGMEAARRQQG